MQYEILKLAMIISFHFEFACVFLVSGFFVAEFSTKDGSC